MDVRVMTSLLRVLHRKLERGEVHLFKPGSWWRILQWRISRVHTKRDDDCTFDDMA